MENQSFNNFKNEIEKITRSCEEIVQKTKNLKEKIPVEEKI